MYEMYPEVWTVSDHRVGAGERPRRRARKQHSVLPEVIVHLQQPGPEPRPDLEAGR